MPLCEYAERDRLWRAADREQEAQNARARELAATDAMLEGQFDEEQAVPRYDDDQAMPDVDVAPSPYNRNRLSVPYSARAIEECCDAWGKDAPQRRAAKGALAALSGGRNGDDPGLAKLRDLQRQLGRLETRERVVNDLRHGLPPEDSEGARIAEERYEYLADGEARRYAKGVGERWLDADGKWRSATAQGMPGDVRCKLLGWRFADKDGRKSDMTVHRAPSHTPPPPPNTSTPLLTPPHSPFPRRSFRSTSSSPASSAYPSPA